MVVEELVSKLEVKGVVATTLCGDDTNIDICCGTASVERERNRRSGRDLDPGDELDCRTVVGVLVGVAGDGPMLLPELPGVFVVIPPN